VESIPQRTFKFAVYIVKFSSLLPKNSAGFAISSQLIRSGTSVGANVEEAQNSPTKKDFIKCITISLKECRETLYWLKIIKEADLVEGEDLVKLISEATELTKILISSVKRSKNGYN
jgi:four helix bundle protein